jgi:hypothetical protein
MKKMPWVKLWRNVLGDEKIAFMMRRYGHETFTFWIGLLTHAEDGVLLEDEEIFADACQLEEKRYAEIRGIFLKYGRVKEDEQKHLVVQNWEEYQVGDSTDRVRRFREKQKQDGMLPKRDGNGDETTEGEGELEGEGEEEEDRGSARAREEQLGKAEESEEVPTSSPPSREIKAAAGKAMPSGAVTPQTASSGEAARLWYARYSQETGRTILPSERDQARGRELFARLGGNLETIDQAVGVFFNQWAEFWFTRSGKRAPYQPDFSFASFCEHIGELLAAPANALKSGCTPDFVTGEKVTAEELRKPTQEDFAIVEEAKRRFASSGAGRGLLASLAL